ncbi:MAG: hypothetical protein MJZ41_03265 [Bacteroidaceae bacterium]|nr:hypothetical protein [Bacteroidaceae bacterium]
MANRKAEQSNKVQRREKEQLFALTAINSCFLINNVLKRQHFFLSLHYKNNRKWFSAIIVILNSVDNIKNKEIKYGTSTLYL